MELKVSNRYCHGMFPYFNFSCWAFCYFFFSMIFKGVSKGVSRGSADRRSVFCRSPIIFTFSISLLHVEHFD